jgi:putative DNA primase/helicase
MSTLEVAADLAANYGWPVFPCRPRDEVVNGKTLKAKSPLTRNGFLDASTDLELIDTWFAHDALLGVPTGKATGLLVIDIDPTGADWYSVNADRLRCGCVNQTRRGHHLIYRMPMPTGVEIRNSTSKLAPGVDVRGEAGYAIWWPRTVCRSWQPFAKTAQRA